MSAGRTIGLDIRPYQEADEGVVLELLDRALGGGPAGRRTAELFRWKHLENPFGRSMMLVAGVDGTIVGLRAFMRWRFRAGSETLSAVRAVDTATSPHHQGRGVFSTLTKRAIDVLREDTDLIFNTPNDRSLPGYLKLGWIEVGTIPGSVRVIRPLAFARGIRSLGGETSPTRPAPRVHAEKASEVLRDEEAVRELLDGADAPDARMHTPVDVGFLRWRYGAAPSLDYRVVAEWSGGHLRGLAFFRLRSRGRLWELAVADVFTRSRDRAGARRLLRSVVASCSADHAMSVVSPGSSNRGAFAAAGFVRSGRGVLLVTRPLRSALSPDPTSLDSWSPTLGTLEVF